jgi:hypothetical protein
MSAADVWFSTVDGIEAPFGQEQVFSFACPKHAGRRCEGLVIAGRTTLKRDPQGQNGGIAQWDWDGDLIRPTFSPSVDCGGCWHGYIRGDRCVSVGGSDEPEP